jgi:hypothetical protein
MIRHDLVDHDAPEIVILCANARQRNIWAY